MEPILISHKGYINHGFDNSGLPVYFEGATTTTEIQKAFVAHKAAEREADSLFVISYKKSKLKLIADKDIKNHRYLDGSFSGNRPKFTKKIKASCTDFVRSPKFYVYLSHTLSAAGDRVWSFAVGLFLITISPESLQLSAFHGLSMGISILLFGALVGDIVDAVPRLKAAQVSLVLQNVFVVICAITVHFFLVYHEDIGSIGKWIVFAFYAFIITINVLARLTSMARQIAVEKDWVVEMCGKDYDMLADMTSSLRRIDLASGALAPLITGLIMDFAGTEYGALAIAGWNVVSVVLEYYLLWKVYDTVPALKKKKGLEISEVTSIEDNRENEEQPMAIMNESPDSPKSKEDNDAEDDEQTLSKKETYNEANNADITESPVDDPGIFDKPEGAETAGEVEVKPEKHKKSACSGFCRSIERLYRGWPIYVRYDVLHAGLALACLYLTVLGFDNITVGYLKMQGISDGLMGGMMAISAIFGILGTVAYPIMRRRLGLPRAGIFGLSIEVFSLTFCVASVWLPGSPFDLSQGFRPDAEPTTSMNCTSDGPPSLISYQNATQHVNLTEPCVEEAGHPESYLSIGMFIAGIVTARLGLWIADLAITQLFMERVADTERGKVSGVQTSLNQLMDMLKFLMVVLAPYEHQFGLLTLISFSFICLGWLNYAYFLRKHRGHFFHFDKCVAKCGNGNNMANGNV